MSTATAAVDQVIEVEQLRCEIVKCLSNKKLPATWFCTHVDAESTCSWLLCAPCARNVKRIVAAAKRLNGNHVTCKGCKFPVTTEDMILRPI